MCSARDPDGPIANADHQLSSANPRLRAKSLLGPQFADRLGFGQQQI
jgi:hypothetical protein